MVVETFSGSHLFDGALYEDADDAYECLMSCVENPPCVGVDFDNRTSTCFFHNVSTECNQLQPKPFCTHYRLTDQCKSFSRHISA